MQKRSDFLVLQTPLASCSQGSNVDVSYCLRPFRAHGVWVNMFLRLVPQATCYRHFAAIYGWLIFVHSLGLGRPYRYYFPSTPDIRRYFAALGQTGLPSSSPARFASFSNIALASERTNQLTSSKPLLQTIHRYSREPAHGHLCTGLSSHHRLSRGQGIRCWFLLYLSWSDV